MKTLLAIIQIIVSIILITLVILQGPSDSNASRMSLVKPKFNRRGIEKMSFIITNIFVFLFLASSFLQLLI